MCLFKKYNFFFHVQTTLLTEILLRFSSVASFPDVFLDLVDASRGGLVLLIFVVIVLRDREKRGKIY